MPQMMPINWILSLMFFISIFIIFNMMNYYIFNVKYTQKKKLFSKMKSLNWKW